MRIDLLYFEGCPHHEVLLPRLQQLVADAGVPDDIALVRIDNPQQAEQERFLGSPTVRIDGVDVDRDAGDRDDYGMKCRLYRTPEGLRGTPPDDWILDALTARR